jgi:hypothetical protein
MPWTLAWWINSLLGGKTAGLLIVSDFSREGRFDESPVLPFHAYCMHERRDCSVGGDRDFGRIRNRPAADREH